MAESTGLLRLLPSSSFHSDRLHHMSASAARPNLRIPIQDDGLAIRHTQGLSI